MAVHGQLAPAAELAQRILLFGRQLLQCRRRQQQPDLAAFAPAQQMALECRSRKVLVDRVALAVQTQLTDSSPGPFTRDGFGQW